MSDTELLHKSKPEPEPVRRLEVFTGAVRRRAWTAEQKELRERQRLSSITLAPAARWPRPMITMPLFAAMLIISSAR